MDEKTTSRVLAIATLTITAVWAISFLAPLTPWAPAEYRPYPELNIAFMGALGLVAELWRRSKKPIDPPDRKEEESNG